MRIVALALTLMLSTALQANVIGPNKDGIYRVDQWGAKKGKEKKDLKLSDKCDYFTVQDETALLKNLPCKNL